MIQKIKLYISQELKKYRFSLSARNSPLFIGFYKYFYKPPTGSLNAFLNAYSLSKKDNFYVIQIGANDGITHDPIHKFVKRDNWKGVLLEPQSYVHDNFLKQVYKKNTGIHTLNAALGKTEGHQTLYKIGFCNMRWATGLSSFNRENVEKAFSNGFVHNQCRKNQIDLPPSSEWIKTEKVMVISPQAIMEKYSISAIDLLQIDVEGFDYEVIKMFDIKKTQPKVIIFEHVHLSNEDIELSKQHLEQNNYVVKRYDANTLAMLRPIDGFESYFENQ